MKSEEREREREEEEEEEEQKRSRKGRSDQQKASNNAWPKRGKTRTKKKKKQRSLHLRHLHPAPLQPLHLCLCLVVAGLRRLSVPPQRLSFALVHTQALLVQGRQCKSSKYQTPRNEPQKGLKDDKDGGTEKKFRCQTERDEMMRVNGGRADRESRMGKHDNRRTGSCCCLGSRPCDAKTPPQESSERLQSPSDRLCPSGSGPPHRRARLPCGSPASPPGPGQTVSCSSAVKGKVRVNILLQLQLLEANGDTCNSKAAYRVLQGLRGVEFV